MKQLLCFDCLEPFNHEEKKSDIVINGQLEWVHPRCYQTAKNKRGY